MSVTIPEEIAVGSFIDGGYTVNDADEGDQLKYALSGIGKLKNVVSCVDCVT